jgi:hypothetical protein
MLIKAIKFSLCTLLVSSNLYGQKMNKDVEVSFGDLKLESGGDPILVSSFKVDDGYLVLKKQVIRGPGGFNYYLEKFDKNLKSIQTHDISQQFEDDKFVLSRILKVGESYVLFTIKDFTEQKKESLFSQTFDWHTGKMSKPKEVYSQTYESRRGNINFNLNTSHDKKRILLTIHPLVKKDEPEEVSFYVYDDQIEEIWADKNITFKESEKYYTIIDTELGNDGQIFLLGSKTIPTERKPGAIRHPNEYEIVTIKDGEKTINKIDVGDKIISEITLSMSEEGSLYLPGYYRKKEGVGIDGVFLFTVNQKSGEIEDQAWDEFSQEFITADWSERQIAKAEKKEEKGTDLGLSNLEFRSIVKHEDGSLSVVGEIFWITYVTTTTASGGTTTRTVYHYGDLIVSRVSKDGDFSSHARFDKHHTYAGAYAYFNLNNQVSILMKDARSTLYEFDKETVTRDQKKEMDGNALVLAEVSQQGDVNITGVMDYTDLKYKGYREHKLVGNESVILRNDNNTEIFVLTYYGKKQFGIARLAFPKTK